MKDFSGEEHIKFKFCLKVVFQVCPLRQFGGAKIQMTPTKTEGVQIGVARPEIRGPKPKASELICCEKLT